jgi:hypothetical protein
VEHASACGFWQAQTSKPAAEDPVLLFDFRKARDLKPHNCCIPYGTRHCLTGCGKVVYVVIPSEARNLSSIWPREKKERFLASLGMTKFRGVFFRSPQSRIDAAYRTARLQPCPAKIPLLPAPALKRVLRKANQAVAWRACRAQPLPRKCLAGKVLRKMKLCRGRLPRTRM